MNNILVLFLFSALLCCSKSASPQDLTNLRDALFFIECTRKAILTGIPEVDIPSHNPLKISENYTFNFSLGLSSVTLNLNNIEVGSIPQWNVTEAYQAVADDPFEENFKFLIYWPLISFSLDWEYDSKSLFEENKNNGTLYVELDHVNFDLLWSSTQPNSGKNGTLDDLSLEVSTTEAQVNVTSLGEVGDIFNAIGGPLVTFLFNNYIEGNALSKSLKEKLINDWVDKPHRISAIMANCNK